ncbi:MAG TPA: phage portal protein [Phycisphaerales bacterium]|nr:phage portal protein [Phycisphaerales bacterium]
MARTHAASQTFAEVTRMILADGEPVSRSRVAGAIERHEGAARARMDRLWAYYRNQMQDGPALAALQPGRGYRLAQERGLPARVVGAWDRRSGNARLMGDDRGWQRKEVVIENDIAWRVQTMVDFMFGRPLTIASTAADPGVRRTIERVLERVWESSGGIALLQDMGLMGHVYGHVDLLVRAVGGRTSETEGDHQEMTPRGPAPRGSGGEGAGVGTVLDRAEMSVRIELIEPPRGVALVSESDYRELDGYVIRTRHEADAEPAGGAEIAGKLLRWWRRGLEGTGPTARPADVVTMTEVFAGSSRQMYETAPDGRTTLVDGGAALVEERLGDRPPIVHIQNISQPFEYEGLGEVEPLIPLQDELNTRLSDRAARVTMQSFKMFLAKGLDGAAAMPVAPGVIWATDNPDAQVTAFGGDAASPSEDRHIDEIREAMDKASAVPPLASGVVRAKIGNLSSENALRITLLGLLSKTSRKRITYGRGIVRASRIVLEALDRLGILHTSEADRGLRVDWVDPIPRDEQQALLAAKSKVELGVPRERVLSELGYATSEDEDAAID